MYGVLPCAARQTINLGDYQMKKTLGAAALLAALLGPAAAQAALTQLTSLFVFGDSLSDGGNSGLASQNYAGVVFPPPPYYNGQYSNGPVAVEYLWNSFNPGNNNFKPSLAGGTNYAIGGATTGEQSFNQVNLSVPVELQPAYTNKSNAWELQTFATQAPSFNASSSLFVVWLFPNDVFYANTTNMLPGTVQGSPGGANLVSNGIANIATTIQTLALAGAQHFLVPNMPNLGLTPEFLGTPQAPGLSFLTGLFNQNLAATLTQIDAALPTVDIVQFDTAALFADLYLDPNAYGFDVADKACVKNLLNGQCNPNKWVFWDGVHPTTKTHQVLADRFRAAVVPEPQTYALTVLGLALVGWTTARRRKTMA
jgi:phospholipase/lecithinase/hemolysin